MPVAVRYGDGNAARVGQRVRAGRRPVEGIVKWFTPPESVSGTRYVILADDSGRIWKRSLSTVQLVGQPARSLADVILETWAADGWPASQREERELRERLAGILTMPG